MAGDSPRGLQQAGLALRNGKAYTGRVVLAGTPAQAAKKKEISNLSSQTIVTPRQRSRVIVRPRRSYLDAGTEVLPGERKFTDYALPAGSYSMPLSVVQSTGGRVGWHQSPLPGPFDLPSRYNPYGW